MPLSRPRRTTRLAALALPLAAALTLGAGAFRSPSQDDPAPLRMEASLATRTLTVRRGDSVVKEYPVAVGQDRHPTPTGRFTVRKMIWNPAWVPPDAGWAKGKKPASPGARSNPMKTIKIFFQEPDYYIHGTGAVESLGDAASHGCLRMDPEQAAALGLLLMDNAGSSHDWEWVKTVLHMGDQRVVNLSVPVPLTIGE